MICYNQNKQNFVRDTKNLVEVYILSDLFYGYNYNKEQIGKIEQFGEDI
jgi:hypothetical protein